MEPSLLLGSSKRARAPNNTTQVVHCLVDGCNEDLSQCRGYHRRHKVCEAHSKTPRVTIGGHEQRFCQQCSRFHSLVEFDEGKRSCRKRLDGHNRRRRKPQPEPLSKNPGVIYSQQGTRLLSFSGQQILPSTAAVSSTWAGIVEETDLVLYNTGSPSNYHSSFPQSLSQSYKGICQFDFMQGTEQTLSKAPLCQQFFDPNSETGNCTSSQSLFRNVLNQVVDSEFARSLLSPAPALVRETVLPHTWQPSESIRERQSLIDNMHCTSLGRYPFSQDMENAPVIPTGYSNPSNSATIHFQEVFQNEPDCSSASESHQTLTFSWG